MSVVLILRFGDGFGTQVKIRSRFTKNGARFGPWPQLTLRLYTLTVIEAHCSLSSDSFCSWMVSLSTWEGNPKRVKTHRVRTTGLSYGDLG